MDTQKYHKILVPTPDVYSLSGAEVFKHLERKDDNDKNLVVVPSQFIEEMRGRPNFWRKIICYH